MSESEARNKRSRRRNLVRWVKRGLTALVAVGLVGSVVIAYLPKPVEVDLASVERGDMKVVVREDGKTRVENRYILSAPLAGNMNRITLEPGDQVNEGDALVRIVPASPPLLDSRTRAESEARLAASVAGRRRASADVNRSRTAKAQAERELAKARELSKAGVASKDEVEVAEFSLQSRRDELRAAEFSEKVAAQSEAQARAALGLLGNRRAGGGEGLDITAPVSGQVLRVLRRDAQGLVEPGAPLLEVGDLASIEVVVDVLTADAVHVKPGARVDIVRWGGERPLSGHVHRIEPSAFTRISALGVEEQRVNVVINIDSPREQWMALGDGYRVEVDIVTWEKSQVLWVPASAVFRRGDSWAVYEADGGVARLRTVDIGQRTDVKVQIISGLDVGARVVTHPGERVADGVELAERPQ